MSRRPAYNKRIMQCQCEIAEQDILDSSINPLESKHSHLHIATCSMSTLLVGMILKRHMHNGCAGSSKDAPVQQQQQFLGGWSL